MWWSRRCRGEMSIRPELNRRSVDQILDRAGPDDHPVGALLAAARQVDSAREVTGERLAVAQFTAGAHLAHIPEQRGVPLMKRVVRNAMAAPVLTIALAGTAFAGGGVALAASQGVLHVPFTGHDNRSDEAPEAPASTNPGLETSLDAPVGSPSESSQPAEIRTASPSPSLDGLCRAYQTGVLKDDTSSPAFAALLQAAGGADNLTSYCVDRVGEPNVPPTRPATPAKPTQAPEATVPPRPAPAEEKAEQPSPTVAVTPSAGERPAQSAR